MTSDRASGAAAGPFAGVQPRNGRQVKWVQNPVLSGCVVGGKEPVLLRFPHWIFSPVCTALFTAMEAVCPSQPALGGESVGPKTINRDRRVLATASSWNFSRLCLPDSFPSGFSLVTASQSGTAVLSRYPSIGPRLPHVLAVITFQVTELHRDGETKTVTRRTRFQ